MATEFIYSAFRFLLIVSVSVSVIFVFVAFSWHCWDIYVPIVWQAHVCEHSCVCWTSVYPCANSNFMHIELTKAFFSLLRFLPQVSTTSPMKSSIFWKRSSIKTPKCKVRITIYPTRPFPPRTCFPFCCSSILPPTTLSFSPFPLYCCSPLPR